jgi:hypothetical protein
VKKGILIGLLIVLEAILPAILVITAFAYPTYSTVLLILAIAAFLIPACHLSILGFRYIVSTKPQNKTAYGIATILGAVIIAIVLCVGIGYISLLLFAQFASSSKTGDTSYQDCLRYHGIAQEDPYLQGWKYCHTELLKPRDFH